MLLLLMPLHVRPLCLVFPFGIGVRDYRKNRREKIVDERKEEERREEERRREERRKRGEEKR